MTLILALTNSRQAIQLSDQRLSWEGKVTNNHANKATVLECVNGRFAVGYTGLAYCKSFNMQRWITDSLYSCGPPDFGIYEVTERFSNKLTHDFSVHPDLRNLGLKDKRLTIMFSGYLYRDKKSLIANILITNFQDYLDCVDFPEARPDFWSIYELEIEDSVNATGIQRVGAWASISMNDLENLQEMLAADKSERAIVDKATAVIRRAADNLDDKLGAAGPVGKDLMTVVIPSDPNVNVNTMFRPAASADIVVLADYVRVHPQCSLVITDLQLEPFIPEPDQPFIRPKPGRNDPCFCGSRKKYKKCHGK